MLFRYADIGETDGSLEIGPIFSKQYKHMGYWWESQKEKRQLGRPKRRLVENTKRDLREIGWDGMDWIDLAQDRDQ
jgi:hypothetical protein